MVIVLHATPSFAAATAAIALLGTGLGLAFPTLAGVPVSPAVALVFGWIWAATAHCDARARIAGALCAALAVLALFVGLEGRFVPALAWPAAQVALAALAAELTAAAAARLPAVGIGGARVRLLAGALVWVPAISAMPGWVAGTVGTVSVVVGGLVAATLWAPCAAALAEALSHRLRRTRQDDETPTGDNAPPAPATPLTGRVIGAAAMVAVAAAVAGADRLGSPVPAHAVALLHLPLALWLARAFPGPAGPLMLAVNGTLLGAALDAALAGPVAPVLLASALFLFAVLQAVDRDAIAAAAALIRSSGRADAYGTAMPAAARTPIGLWIGEHRRHGAWVVGIVLPDVARFGHLLGDRATDEVEQTVAGRVRTAFAPQGRLEAVAPGALLLLLDENLDGIAIRQRLHGALRGTRVPGAEQPVATRWSAGIVEVPPASTVAPDEVLATVSAALRRAASEPSGLYRTTVSSDTIGRHTIELLVIDEVREALAKGRVALYAELIEPISGRADPGLHYEVLARVVTASGEVLLPRAFLPAMLQAGLTERLDRLVFARTVEFLAKHRGLRDVTRSCSVNVCGSTLCDPEFPEYVKRCLEANGLPAGCLTIEVSQSGSIPDLELAREHLTRIRAMGLSIALDDFGTGAATFEALKRLPADVIKLDGSFVRNLDESALDREIVTAFVRSARAVGARAAVEWIERPSQRTAAVGLGVDYLQGRLIAEPVPIEKIGAAARAREAAPPRRAPPAVTPVAAER